MTITPAMLRAILSGEVALTDATPEGIRSSEKRGQAEVVGRDMLPLKLRPNQAAFEELGFSFGEKIDDVFQSATLPDGWSKRPTDHDMWSKIVDQYGNVRVNVFYKAAFYDRDAEASLVTDYAT